MSEHSHHDASSNVLFGFWIYLMTDLILFATLFATYAVLRPNTAGGPSGHDLFHLPYTLLETLVLLASSFTCSMALTSIPRRAKSEMVFWLLVTFVLGCVFMFMEWGEFSHLVQDGNGWQRSGFLSAYFTLIGTHGAHILTGLIFMLLFIAQLLRRGFTDVVIRRLTCMKIYWNFLYFVWIFTFTLVYLIGAN